MAGFAHKPMTEFVATALLVTLLGLCVRPVADRPVAVRTVAALAVLVTAIRMRYAPAASILLGLFFVRSGRRLMLVLAVAALVAAVGVFDAVTWSGGLFHSYGVNIAYNLVAGGLRAGESPPWQFLWWLALAGAGLNLLLIGADLATRLTAGLDARRQARSSPKAAAGHSFAKSAPAGVIAAVFAAVSAAGILNALPYQYHVYRGRRASSASSAIRTRSSPIRRPARTRRSARAVSHVVSADPALAGTDQARLAGRAHVRRRPSGRRVGADRRPRSLGRDR